MHPIILLGAGFSRNWGGYLGSEVFEYLLSCPEVGGDPTLREMLWRTRTEGFEVALGELQAGFKENPARFAEPLREFQGAIASMFTAMNSAFARRGFDFPPTNIATSVTYFLSQFDAIFTLNQDLLLESHYMGCNFSNGEHYRQWAGQKPPGLEVAIQRNCPEHLRFFHHTWRPVPETEFEVGAGIQPIWKLHGSSNWVERDGSELLVMGGGKEETIGDHPILAWYGREFERAMRIEGARLMIVGYGFRDQHINRMIARAVGDCGLKLFIIGPQGSDIAAVFRSSEVADASSILYGYDLEAVFARGLIGASRRGLGEIFGTDAIEHAKVMRFFES